MNQLLITIPFCKADEENAGRLLDWIYHLGGKRRNGFVLLAAAHDVHAETIEKLKISAELAFDTFDAIKVGQVQTNYKDLKVNKMFKAVASHVARNYRVPWMWCEPDLTPLDPMWMWRLAAAYYNQPKRYMSLYFKAHDLTFPARCGVYPHDAINDLGPLCDSATQFNRNSGLIVATTKTDLVREIHIASSEDYEKVDLNASVAVHSDKLGLALAAREEELASKAAGKMAPAS